MCKKPKNSKHPFVVNSSVHGQLNSVPIGQLVHDNASQAPCAPGHLKL